MIEKYYYFRDNKNRPIVTVCLVKDELGQVHRGMAICSLSDNPVKSKGRNIAKGRALKALFKQVNSEVINVITSSPAMRALDPVWKTMKPFWYPYKSTCQAPLADFEKRIMES